MHKRFVLSVCIILLFILSGGLNVCASTIYGFETTDLSENEINQIWRNINIRYSSDAVSLDSIGLPIISFDVSENGMILLGFKGNKVVVADEKNVIKSFEFTNDGSFYVQWKDNNILILLVRGSVIIEVSQDGQLINMIRADDTDIQNNSLWNQISENNSINIGQFSYSIKNEMGIFNFFASSYSKLLKTDSKGNSTVIYDVSSAQLTKTITIFITVVLFFGAVIAVIVSQFFRRAT